MSTEENIFEEVHGLLRQTDEILAKNGESMPAIEADILKEQLRRMYTALLPKATNNTVTQRTDSQTTEKTVAELLAPPEHTAKAATTNEGLYAPAEPEPAPRPAMNPMMEQLEGNPFDNLFDGGAPRFVDTPAAPEPPAKPVTVKPVVETPAKPKAADNAKPVPAAPKAVNDEKHETPEVREQVKSRGQEKRVPEGETKPAQSHTGQGNGITLMDFLRQSSEPTAPTTNRPTTEPTAPHQSAEPISKPTAPRQTEISTPAMPHKPAEPSTPRQVADAANAPITLADKLGLNSTVESQVGTKVSHSKVSDLRTIININDKFSFMSELFHNNMKAYNDFILRLNAITDRQTALEHVQLIAQEFQWDMESLAVKTFYSIFDRKF